MADLQFQTGESSEPEKPAILIPVMAEDVARRKRQLAAMMAAAAIAVVILGWYVYRRTVDPVDARRSYADGVRLFQANRYEQAILNFSRAVDLKPDLVEAYRMRGRAYAAIGKPDDAIPDFTKVSALQPRDAAVLVERGFAYLDKKDLTRALADASSALALNGKLARAYNLRATAERSAGDTAKAIEDFSHAVDLDPNLDNYFQRAPLTNRSTTTSGLWPISIRR